MKVQGWLVGFDGGGIRDGASDGDVLGRCPGVSAGCQECRGCLRDDQHGAGTGDAMLAMQVEGHMWYAGS